MSDFCQMSFVASEKLQIKLKRRVRELWDACGVEHAGPYHKDLNRYNLTISELDLREALAILDILKREYGDIPFVIEYGVY